MKLLAIDTSGKKLILAARNADMVALASVDCAMQHSVRLMEEIDAILKKTSLTLPVLDTIACVVGPGSFTGIRIGISTAKGLCFGADRRATAVTSLEAVAYADEETDKISLVDAGHGHVYAQGFGRALLPAGFYAAEEIVTHSAKTGACLLAGEDIPGLQVRLVDVAKGLLRAAERGTPGDPALLAAVYLRKSNAEEGR